MEFFMQTLVKKGVITQRTMLLMQRLLMSVSTLAAVRLLALEHLLPPLLSLILNFTNRGHDVMNTMCVLLLYISLPLAPQIAS